jgi:hypothetical protein
MTAMRLILATICVLALLATACPQRHNFKQIVYTVPPPVPQATLSGSQPARSAGSLIIQEPAEPDTNPASDTEPPKPVDTPPARRPSAHRPARDEPPVQTDEKPPEDTSVLVDVPPLEPRTTASRQEELRRQLGSNQRSIRERIDRLDQRSLAQPDRKTLNDARNFLQQSEGALKEGELERSRLLARKAELLVAALEQEY